jgi:hypothetical protein
MGCSRRALLVAAPAVCACSRGDGPCSMTPYAGWRPLCLTRGTAGKQPVRFVIGIRIWNSGPKLAA